MADAFARAYADSKMARCNIEITGRTGVLFKLLLRLEREKLRKHRRSRLGARELAETIIKAYIRNHEEDILEDATAGLPNFALEHLALTESALPPALFPRVRRPYRRRLPIRPPRAPGARDAGSGSATCVGGSPAPTAIKSGKATE